MTPLPDYDACEVTPEFAQPVDLDGDGVADLTHERYRSFRRYDRPRTPTSPPKLVVQDDIIEAYYPAGHVEMYWLIWGPTFGDPEPRLAAGHELVPAPEPVYPGPGGIVPRRYGSWGLPEPARSYVYPTFEAIGLGIISRFLEMAPCPLNKPPFDDWCAPKSYTGYLYREPEHWDDPLRADEYFGFRLRREDGWHLGWLRLRWVWVEGDPNPDPVELVASVVHPEPDTALVVGEPARPTLRYERPAAGGLVVRWSTVWAQAVLERSPSLTAPDWVQVSGTEPHAAHLPATEAPGFFRLRVP